MHDDANFWWDVPRSKTDPKVHLHLYDHVRTVEQRQQAIHRLNLYNAKLYSNRDLRAIDWRTGVTNYTGYGPASRTMENLVGNVVDSVTALIGRNRPKVTPVVRDADFSIERESRKLDRFLWAEFNYLDVYRKMQRVFNDSLWAQIGALKVDIDGGEVYCERVMPDEIIVDQRECISSQMPLQMHQRKLISKMQLATMYPDYAEEILGDTKRQWTKQRRPDKDHCVVIESWFLGLPGLPGRHVICTENLTFVDEEYTRERFPFIFLRWTELPSGFYSKSLVEELTPYQLRQNELNRVIKLSQDLMCSPRIFVEGSARFQKLQLDNDIARIISYRGQKPEAVTWPAVSADLYAERDRNRASAFEFAGISQMFAQAKPAEGVRFDSSKALREFNFRENERFAPQAQALEQAYLELADHLIELYSKLGKKAKRRKANWRDQRLVDLIQWDDIDLDRERYVLELQASSVNNMSPAAREDQIQTWMQQGRIDSERANMLSGHPDLEEAESLMRAGMDNIKWTVEKLDDGELPQPEPLQNLLHGIPFIHQTFLRRQTQTNVPLKVLQAYRDWLSEAEAVLNGDQSAATQNTLAQPNIGPEGNIQPAIATTAQGTPVDALV